MTDTSHSQSSQDRKPVWKRGLFMLIFAILMEIAGTVLVVVAIIQFFWLLFNGDKNDGLSRFGSALGKWFGQTVAYQTCNTEERPFPWAKWPDEQE